MKWFLIVLVPILVYIGLGWIAKDIYFSVVDNSLTIHGYYMTEIWIYNIIAAAYCGILAEARNIGIIPGLIPIGLAILLNFLPMSTGAALLNTIVCIIDMIFCTAVAVE